MSVLLQFISLFLQHSRQDYIKASLSKFKFGRPGAENRGNVKPGNLSPGVLNELFPEQI
jgi:hypothetical protein